MATDVSNATPTGENLNPLCENVLWESPMEKSVILQIVGCCRRIDTAARDLYAKLGELSEGQQLKAFWREMSAEEGGHVAFWERLEGAADRVGLPDLFDNPEGVLAELSEIAEKTNALVERCGKDFTEANAFVLAYRMEFYLLHPAFEMLFHTMGGYAGESNPEEGYRDHIDRFIKVSSLYSKVTLEQALIGEMLHRLWKQNQLLARQATRDHLTGLLNRRGFFSIGTQLAFLAQRNKSVIGVMVVGVEKIKEITESRGHEASNAVLKGVSELITQTLRTSDLVGRYSGDEFAVLLSAVSPDGVMQVAEKIRSTVAVDPIAGFTVTVSIGVADGAIEEGAAEDLYVLLRNADLGLYRAKKAGGNRVMRYAMEK